MSMGRARPLVITGATGTLGRAFANICTARGIPFRLLTRGEMDIADPAAVETKLRELDPWAVVNTAGFVRVDQAEQEAAACMRENSDGPAIVAAECARRGAMFVTFSSDLVFDGREARPYVESDAVAPLNVYGRSKAEAEHRVLDILPAALVIRTSAFFGPWDTHNFVHIAIDSLIAGRRFTAAADARVSPTYVPDLVHATLDLLIDGESGIWHLSNKGEVTWAELAYRAAEILGLETRLIEERSTASFNLPAQRPSYSVLSSERASLMPSLEDALSRYAHERWGHVFRRGQEAAMAASV